MSKIITTNEEEYELQTCKCHNCGLIKNASFDFYPCSIQDEKGFNYLVCEKCLTTIDPKPAKIVNESLPSIEVRKKKEKAKAKDIWETI